MSAEESKCAPTHLNKATYYVCMPSEKPRSIRFGGRVEFGEPCPSTSRTNSRLCQRSWWKILGSFLAVSTQIHCDALSDDHKFRHLLELPNTMLLLDYQADCWSSMSTMLLLEYGQWQFLLASWCSLRYAIQAEPYKLSNTSWAMLEWQHTWPEQEWQSRVATPQQADQLAYECLIAPSISRRQQEINQYCWTSCWANQINRNSELRLINSFCPNTTW